jgi:hypothetical protein
MEAYGRLMPIDDLVRNAWYRIVDQMDALTLRGAGFESSVNNNNLECLK